MLNKPDACKPCAFYDDGKGFVPDEIVPGAVAFTMMQNPGQDEETDNNPRPAIGASGQYMDSSFIPLSGLARGTSISVGNVIKCRWRDPRKGVKTNALPSETGAWDPAKHEFNKKAGEVIEKEAAAYCLKTHTVIPEGTKLIIAQGDLAWSNLTDTKDSITEWRGFLAPSTWRGVPVFGTYHTAYVLRFPRMSIPVMSDWQRVKEILNGNWPKPVPNKRVVPYPMDNLPSGCTFVTIDTEFDDDYNISLVGIAYWGAGPEPICGEQIPASMWNYELTRERLTKLVQRIPVVPHNAIAETISLEKTFGIGRNSYLKLEDTMQLHALLHSEWPHTLAFVESMHGRHNRMKHLADTDFLLYNWGDCLTPGYAFKDMMRLWGKDPLSFRVYEEQNLPLIPIRHEAKLVGLDLDTEFLATLSYRLAERIQYAQSVAEGYAGIQLNLGSHPQFTTWLKDVEHIKLKKKRGSDVYSADKDTVATMRREFLDFDPEEETDGITNDMLDRNIGSGGHPLLEARAAYQNAVQLYTHYVEPLLVSGVKDKGVVRGYSPSEFVRWISPTQHTHAQASGRWSVTNPPLATLPEKLRAMIRPPKGYVMPKYDVDHQELRLNAHLANDEPTLEVFANGWDIHTLNTCDVFYITVPPDKGDPHGAASCEVWRVELHWEGKHDRRRVFCKRFVFRLIYRGNPRYAWDIPGAKTMGLTQHGLVEASQNYLSRHPALPKHWARLDAQILATRTTRSFRGRKRFLNSFVIKSKYGEVPPAMREGTNHPIQSGGVDWNNITILTLYHECRDLSLVWGYGSHDSHNWLVSEKHEYTFLERVEDVTQRPWDVDGRPLVLPVTFEPTVYPL